MRGSRSADVKVWRCRSADVKVWRCRSADVKVWRCRSADVKVWRCRSADVKVWRCRSADVKVRSCRSTDVKVWRCRSADVKVWRRRSADGLQRLLFYEEPFAGDLGKNKEITHRSSRSISNGFFIYCVLFSKKVLLGSKPPNTQAWWHPPQFSFLKVSTIWIMDFMGYFGDLFKTSLSPSMEVRLHQFSMIFINFPWFPCSCLTASMKMGQHSPKLVDEVPT